MKRMDNTLNNPLISIIVPVYNVEKYLEMSVRSIINQTYSNLEIILVDDGSTDKSGELCDRLADDDGRIKVIHQENKGLGAARNTGINHMAGNYLMFIDSDDELETNAVEILYSKIIEHKATMSACALSPSFKQGMPTKQGADKQRASMELLSGMEYLLKYRHPSACCILYDRKIFAKVRFKEGILCEDTQLIPRLLVKVTKLIFVGNIKLYYYLKHEDSIMQNFRKASLHPDMAVVTYENIGYFRKYYGKSSDIAEKMMVYHIEQCLRKFADTRECNESFKKLFRNMIEKYCYDICQSERMADKLKEAALAVAAYPEKALVQLKWDEIFEACENHRREFENNSISTIERFSYNSTANNNSGTITDEKYTYEKMEALNFKVDKFKNYYNMLNHWLKLKYEGKELCTWFIDKNIKTIAIYGMGEMGNRLYDALRGSNIKVSYAIDKAAGYSYSEVKVYDIGNDLPAVDAIVVTATFAYNSIREKLGKVINCRVVNLEEIIYGIK